MRWLAVPLAIALAWLIFTLSPLWALYDLARAVRAHDVAYVEHHVNFRTLRYALVRQIAAAVREAADANPNLDARERQQLGDAALGLGLALAESKVTPETVIDLLDDGWPENFDIPRPQMQPPAGLNLDRVGKLVPYYLASEMRGFRTVVVPVPPDAPRAAQTRIRLRLRGWTWRLIDIEVNAALRQRMAESLAKAIVKAQQGGMRN